MNSNLLQVLSVASLPHTIIAQVFSGAALVLFLI